MNLLRVGLALVFLALVVACGGDGEDDGSASVTPTSRRTPSRTATPAPSPTSTAVSDATPTAAAPAPATDAPAPAPTEPPQPVATEPPAPVPQANNPPAFPDSGLTVNSETNFDYDDEGSLTGATTTITIGTPPSDPDGDALSYSWSASNGSIAGSGLSATWTRVIDFGEPQPGIVTVIVSDGRGGSDTLEIDFQ